MGYPSSKYNSIAETESSSDFHCILALHRGHKHVRGDTGARDLIIDLSDSTALLQRDMYNIETFINT